MGFLKNHVTNEYRSIHVSSYQKKACGDTQQVKLGTLDTVHWFPPILKWFCNNYDLIDKQKYGLGVFQLETKPELVALLPPHLPAHTYERPNWFNGKAVGSHRVIGAAWNSEKFVLVWGCSPASYKYMWTLVADQGQFTHLCMGAIYVKKRYSDKHRYTDVLQSAPAEYNQVRWLNPQVLLC
jgi:hypothetical protein